MIDDVFVPDERVLADRPYGVVDGPLQVIFGIGFSVISGVYLGVAEGARDHALERARPRSTDVLVQRRVGLMQHRTRVAGWALDGALEAVGEQPTPSMGMLADVMAAKREIALAGIEVCDVAMELAGGAGFFRGDPIERAYRDIRGIKFHPFDLESTLVHAGQVALGLPADAF